MTLKINRQEPITDIVNISFDVGDTEKWEHLLPGEPTHLRVDCPIPDDIDGLTKEEELSKEKHLDMPASWVQQLHINHTGRDTIFCVFTIIPCYLIDFDERYPNGAKIIHYKRAIYERFAPYRKRSGLVARLTTYDTLDYVDEVMRWEWYANRRDLLQVVVINLVDKQLEEYFVKGRSDSLKCEH